MPPRHSEVDTERRTWYASRRFSGGSEVTFMSETTLQKPTKKRKASHKQKAVNIALIIAAAIALLEAIPYIKHAIETGDTQPLAEHTKRNLHEMQDAGVFE